MCQLKRQNTLLHNATNKNLVSPFLNVVCGIAILLVFVLILAGCAPKKRPLRASIQAVQNTQIQESQPNQDFTDYEDDKNFKRGKKGTFKVALLIPKQLVGRYSVNIFPGSSNTGVPQSLIKVEISLFKIFSTIS